MPNTPLLRMLNLAAYIGKDTVGISREGQWIIRGGAGMNRYVGYTSIRRTQKRRQADTLDLV
jgi:hypothetical protein